MWALAHQFICCKFLIPVVQFHGAASDQTPLHRKSESPKVPKPVNPKP